MNWQLTRWFKPDEPPVRKGYYETRRLFDCLTMVTYWNGKDWQASKKSKPWSVLDPRREWRGLAHPPR